MVRLFAFQREAVDAVSQDWKAGFRSLLVSLPTGSGKTIVAAEVARHYHERTGEPVLFLVHRDEILQQTVEQIALACNSTPVGVVQRNCVQLDRPVTVASVDTLVRHLRAIPPVGLIMTDEAHHAEAPTWLMIYHAVQQNNPHFLHLGMTATPFRMDKHGELKALSGVFERLSYTRSLFDLISAGYLAPLRGISITTGTHLEGVKVAGGDFEEHALARVVNTPARNRLVVSSYLQHCPGQKAICFTAGVDHAYALADEFRRQGIAAAALSHDTPLQTRRQLRHQFRTGELLVLCNCGVLTEGYDEPSAVVCIAARPTQSRVLYIQQVGRVCRLWPGKTEGVILDLVDAHTQHRLVSMAELLAFYGLRKAQVQLSTTTSHGVPPDARRTAKTREYRLTPTTLAEIASLSELSPIVREVDLFRIDAFAWHQASDGNSYVVSLYDGVSLGVVTTGSDDRFEVIATFRAGVFARLLPQPTSLQNAIACANAYLFDFGDLRLASRTARWRTSEPTAGQRVYLQRVWAQNPAETARLIGDPAKIQHRGPASGAISALALWRTLRHGTEVSREWALTRFRERYGGERDSETLLPIDGEQDAPLAGALRRYHVELRRAKQGTFAFFLARTLERCTLRVQGKQLILAGGNQTASYTEAQWSAIRDVLARELGRLGEVEVIVCPTPQPGTHESSQKGGTYACAGR